MSRGVVSPVLPTAAQSFRPIVHDVAVRALRVEVIHVALHPVVVAREDACVAAVLVQVPRDQQERAVPGRAVAPVVAPAAGGHDAGQLAVSALLVAEVVDPLGVDGRGRRS